VSVGTTRRAWADRHESKAMTPNSAVRELQEFIAALDRRVPQVRRAGEMSIAREVRMECVLAIDVSKLETWVVD
jgi:hypothetical protein